MKASRLIEKVPSPLIQKQQRAAAANHKKILPSLVFKVGEQGARSIVEHADAGFFRYVFKRPVAPVAVKPVWQARRLANIEIIEAVIVEVARRHAIVAVNVDAACAIQNCPPIVGAREASGSCTIPRGREPARLCQ